MSSAAQQALARRVSDLDAIEYLLERAEEMFPFQPDTRAPRSSTTSRSEWKAAISSASQYAPRCSSGS